MKKKNLFFALFVTLTPFVSFAEGYEVSKNRWSFNLITDTCGDQLEAAIKAINLPASTVITYPETIEHRYFSLEFRSPGSSEVSKYEFEYWTEGDEQLVCERVEPMDWIY
jgi:hypothetical protein